MLYRILFLFILVFTGTIHAQSSPDTTKRAETLSPDTMTATEIGAIILDRHVYKFTITWVSDGAMYRYEVYGNGVYGEAREKIEKLPSGTTVVIADIKRKEDDGSETIAPSQIHTVR